MLEKNSEKILVRNMWKDILKGSDYVDELFALMSQLKATTPPTQRAVMLHSQSKQSHKVKESMEALIEDLEILLAKTQQGAEDLGVDEMSMDEYRDSKYSN